MFGVVVVGAFVEIWGSCGEGFVGVGFGVEFYRCEFMGAIESPLTGKMNGLKVLMWTLERLRWPNRVTLQFDLVSH